MFAPTTRPYLQRLEFDTIWNVFLASVDAHNSFARLKAYFEPTETRHVYRIVALERVGPDFHSVADFSDHGTHDPPAPELFASHAALCRVLEASGAARYIRAKQEDDEHLERQGVLNTDGSTDLSSFFWRHGIPTT